jgi:anti-anti-sigma factor
MFDYCTAAGVNGQIPLSLLLTRPYVRSAETTARLVTETPADGWRLGRELFPLPSTFLARRPQVQTFRIKAVPGDGTCTLVLFGEADLAVADDIVELGTVSLSEPATHTLCIDLAAVTFIDSTSIGALVRLRNIAIDQDKKLVLVAPQPRLLRTLDLSGLHGIFDIS